MKTRLLIIIGITIVIAIVITSISLAYNQEIKLATGMMTSDEKPEPTDGIFYPRYHISIFHNPKTMWQYITNDFITIGPHSQVTWSNYGDTSVTINSKNSDDQWNTGVILPQGYATITFNKTGIYEYGEDSRINGVIVVMDDGGELLSSKFSDVFGNGSPLMYTEGMEPVLLYDNCKRYAYWLNEHGKEKIDLYEDYPRYPPWGNQIFPLVDFCVTNGDLVKTISGDHYRWEFQLGNDVINTKPESTTPQEHYAIEITGLKDVYIVGERYDFSYILSGYGHPCGGKTVTFPDSNGDTIASASSASCIANLPMGIFVFDIQKEQGTTYGHVEIKNPGTYTITVTFDKPSQYFPTTVSKEFRVVEK